MTENQKQRPRCKDCASYTPVQHRLYGLNQQGFGVCNSSHIDFDIPTQEADTSSLFYWAEMGPDLWVGEKFGCIHWNTREVG